MRNRLHVFHRHEVGVECEVCMDYVGVCEQKCAKSIKVHLHSDSGEDRHALEAAVEDLNTHKYLHVSQMAGEKSQGDFICHISDERGREYNLEVFISRLRELKTRSSWKQLQYMRLGG